MKKILFMTTVVFMGLLLAVSASIATPINPIGGGGSEASLQAVLNSITIAPTAGVSSVNVNTDQVASDAYWSQGGAGGTISTIVIEIAGWKDVNSFGVFSGNNMVQIFAGSANQGTQATMSILADGSVLLNSADTGVDFAGNLFGYYIGTPNGTFYSDMSKNADALDHMVAFQGKGIDTIQIQPYAPGVWSTNEFVLAFEDTKGLGDWDYQDLVVIVESVQPVPEPSTLLLICLGLLGIGITKRKS